MIEDFEDELWADEASPVDLGQRVEAALYEFVISYYTYQAVIDMYMPHLEVVSNYGDRQVVPFFGPLVMKLSAERYCSNCFKRIEVEDNFCEACRRELGLEFLTCVRDGPGLGKGHCDLTNPECGSEFCVRYCGQDHVVYLVLFANGRLKVGMSRADRCFLRLLEQGASYAMIFQEPEERRNFIETHQIEQRIAEEFGISDAVRFEEKLHIFKEGRPNLKEQIAKLQAYKRIFKAYYQLQEKVAVDFSPLHFPIPVEGRAEKEKLQLNGDLIGFRGNVGYIRENGAIVAFDLNKLKGRKIENVTG